MPMRFDRIQEILKSSFPALTHMEITDESNMHAGRQGQESHLKVLLVTPEFDKMNRVQRQRKINQLLASEFEQSLHALSMRLLTPEEFEKQIEKFETPNCQSGK